MIVTVKPKTDKQVTEEQLRRLAEKDLFLFAQLVNPQRLYGELHKEVFKWLQQDTENLNQLLLLPRAHQKSHCIAVWCAWWIACHPETTILYLSATSELAESQLYDIKNIMTSKIFIKYWPGMNDPDEGKREKWATTAMSVDHPRRKQEGVRDHTIRTAGLTTNTTGWHADVVIADDVVVPDNAYTLEGRRKVERAMSQMVSIRNNGGMTKACGTRYHPVDIYQTWKDIMVPTFDDDDNIIGEKPSWTVFERAVEEDNNFIWPREYRKDGKAFGFDIKSLASIKVEYLDRTQFYAQYYNNPNDVESNRIDASNFQYYEQKHLVSDGLKWTIKGEAMNVYASIDFAFSLGHNADYTAIVVIGVARSGMIYILDIDRFKTDKIQQYYKHIAALHATWHFKRLRAEVSVAQVIIVRDLKERLRKEGLALPVEEYRPRGKKEERIAAVLEPRYETQLIWHYKGGHTAMLEDEILLARPPHDDMKDALASVIEMALPPRNSVVKTRNNFKFKTNSRFGGVQR